MTITVAPQDQLAHGRMNRDTYSTFLGRKAVHAAASGPTVDATDVHPALHDWQNRIVRWAVERRRAAIWADTGLGKTWMQVEWARHSGDTALIVAPLAVCAQTVREAAKLGVFTRFVHNDDEITGPGVWITNYERVQHIDPGAIDDQEQAS